MVWPVFCHFLINHTETNCVIKGWSMVPKPNLSLCLIWKEAELFTITCILVLQPPERAFISYFLPFRHLQDKRGPGSTELRTYRIEWIPRKKQKKRMGLQKIRFTTLQMFCLLNPQMNACEPSPNTTVSDFNS